MHHFGRDCFSVPAEHWVRQLLLTHSINGDLFGLSSVSALEVWAAASDFRGDGFVRDKVCPAGVASGGSCRLKIPQFAHPARPRARSATNSHFILAPIVRGFRRPSQDHAVAAGASGINLPTRLLIGLAVNSTRDVGFTSRSGRSLPRAKYL